MSYSMQEYYESVLAIESHIGEFRPQVLITLGSGLGSLADQVEDPIYVEYRAIPHFKKSTAPGHQGRFVFGILEGKRVAVMQGRLHYYEGYSLEDIGYAVRVLKLLGATHFIVTNAAGCVNTEWNAGELMLISDHIKFFLDSPLRGKNIDEFGVRFPDLSELYAPELRLLAKQAAEAKGITLREGSYMFFPGPQYETPAEVRAARILGADAVGMSTVPEAITAGHAGMKVLGITLLTNMAAGIKDTPLTEEDVLQAGERGGENFVQLVRECLKEMVL